MPILPFSSPPLGDSGVTAGSYTNADITVNAKGQVTAASNGSGGSSPLTTKGDIYTYSTTDARLPVGTDGQILSADSTQTTGLKWTTAGGTGTVTSVGISGANGIGVSGSPITSSGTIDLSLGTLTGTTWEGNVIGSSYGGAGSVTGILKADGSGNVSAAVSGTDYAPATSGSSILYGDGSGGFSGVTIGTGLSFSGGTLSATGESGTVTSVAVSGANGIGVSGSPITSSGTIALSLGTLTGTTWNGNVIGSSYGGAGSISGILKANGSGTVSAAISGTDYAPATSGSSILYGNGSGGFSAVTVGTGLSFSSGTLSSTIHAGIVWNNVTGTSQTASINNGYIANNSSLVTITLPSTAVVGSIVRIAGAGAGGWKVAQNSSQQINYGVSSTTSGTGGSLASVNRYDAAELLCIIANTTWAVISSQGNITVV